MTLTASEVWQRLLKRVEPKLTEQAYSAWLVPAEPLDFDGSRITIGMPDQFTADWNASKHAELLESLAPIVLGHPLEIIFKVQEERKSRPQMDLFVRPVSRREIATPLRDNSALLATLNPRYTFDNFVVGKSNELAAAAANAITQAPGKVYNPLFIYGNTGLGKTHLMQATAHEILRRLPVSRLIYIGAEQFTNEYVQSIQTRSTRVFRERYREIDLLLVDDIHFLKGKEATQEEFFHTFNVLYEAGRQIVMTSDRSPSDIPGIEARLVSRFQWGMVTDVELPDLEHRTAILSQKAHQDHLEQTIPDQVIRFIAENIRSNIRELEGSVIKLLAYASLKHREITLELAKEALRDRLRPELDSSSLSPQALTVKRIQDAVAKEWGVSRDGLLSKARTKNLTIPRQAAIFLCRELLNTQLMEIGTAFGGRDHSTVIHSLDRAASLIKTDEIFRSRIEKLLTLYRLTV